MTGTQVLERHTTIDNDDPTPVDIRAAARDDYRRGVADGKPPTGAELGRRYGQSERWGRYRIAECRNNGNGDRPDDRPEPSGQNGSHDVPPAEGGTSTGIEAERSAVPVVPDEVPDVPVAVRPESVDGTWSRRIIRWITTVAVIVVAACAARSSYEHQRTVVEMAGNPEAALYLPLSVDGMMLIASLNMLVRRWDNQPAGWLTWTALLLGGAASLAANIAAAPPTLIGRLVAAWSPVCLIVSYELLMQQLPHRAAAEAPEGRQR